jgi:putative flippase GtrA
MNTLRALLRSEKIRFLIVGGWNTAVGYAIFIGMHLLLGQRLPPEATITLAYCLALPHSYFTQRLLVFRPTAGSMTQFGRFCLSNTSIFLANLVLMPLSVRAFGWEPVLAQGGFLVASTLATFVLHKYYSFSRHRP